MGHEANEGVLEMVKVEHVYEQYLWIIFFHLFGLLPTFYVK